MSVPTSNSISPSNSAQSPTASPTLHPSPPGPSSFAIPSHTPRSDCTCSQLDEEATQTEQGTVNYSVLVSRQSGAATARSTSALEKDPGILQTSLPFRRTAAALVLGRGEYARTLDKYFGVEQGTLIDAVQIVAVLEQDTLAATAVGKWIVAVDTLVGVEDKRTAEADTSEESTAVGGSLGSSVHSGRSELGEKSVGIFVRAAEVDYNQTRLQMDSRSPGRVA